MTRKDIAKKIGVTDSWFNRLSRDALGDRNPDHDYTVAEIESIVKTLKRINETLESKRKGEYKNGTLGL